MSSISEIPQYSFKKILLVWAAAAVPMGVLGWVVAPALAPATGKPGFERVAVLMLGLIWQFLLAMYLVYDETGTLSWAVVRQRLWLQKPRDPRTGESRARVWWWLIPIVLVTALYQTQVMGVVQRFWVSVFPFLADRTGLSFGSLLNTPAAKLELVGNWGVLALFIVSALFNTVLGEELLFRGLLLPRMAGVFAKWDWVANGVLFGVYHLHQPWGILGSAIQGVFLFALPSRYFRSAWFGIVAHSGQSLYLSILILGLVLGFK